ncbi:hypothetical protein Gogos_008501, partial [Gossypium gossypioides]|nr:hypothetical protein [Gossypium gossypioides]
SRSLTGTEYSGRYGYGTDFYGLNAKLRYPKASETKSRQKRKAENGRVCEDNLKSFPLPTTLH